MTDIGGQHHGVREVSALEVTHKDGVGGEVIRRRAEEAMHLGRMQRHGHDVVGPSGGEEVGDQPAGDGNARLVLLVGAAIRIIRDDGVDRLGRGATRGVEHHEQLEDIITHVRRERLDDNHLFAADALPQVHKEVVVAEPFRLAPTEAAPQIVRDLLG